MEVRYAKALSTEDGAAFDRFVDDAAGGHAFQTRAWARVAVADGTLGARFLLARVGGRVVGAAVVLRPQRGPLLAPFARIERGPVCVSPTELAPVLTALAHVTRARGIARLSVMPYFADEDVGHAEAALARTRFRSVQGVDGAHVVTLRVDLARGGSDDPLFAGGAYEALRRKRRQAERSGATARRGGSADLVTLARLHRTLMEVQRKRPKSVAWFESLGDHVLTSRGALFIGESAGVPLAGVLATRHGRVATFVLGASTIDARPFSKMVLPMCAAIEWARDTGCTHFDLGGVPMDADVDPKRRAIAQFKLDFAKTPVRLVGEHARWL